MLYVCLVCPSYHKAGLASLVCILCYRTGSHTEKDLVLDLMFYCHSLEVLNILLDKEACISFFFFFRSPIPKSCSWLCLKDRCLGILSSQSLFPSEHSTNISGIQHYCRELESSLTAFSI